MSSNTLFLILVLIFSLVLTVSGFCDTQTSKEAPRTINISSGDRWYVVSIAIDSKATIEEFFKVIAEDFGITRVWWRGGQDELWKKYCEFRDQNNVMMYRRWVWHLIEDVGANRIAVEAAHKNKMTIWLCSGMFEGGAQADTGGAGGYPYSIEDKLRIEHPEWIPVNRYGTRKQAGPLEFAYPEARKITIDRLTQLVVSNKYDGLVLYTYVENLSIRYFDEFGYNKPIVDEFKKRYGVDIRYEPFDKDAWAKLRGEYVTQFLRELHASLASKGKKLGVVLDHGDSHLPWAWGKPGTRTAGHIYIDWNEWVKEGIVDELSLWWPDDEKTVTEVADACKGTSVNVSTSLMGDKLPPGVTNIGWYWTEVESGFKYENHIGEPNENMPPQSLGALAGDDIYAKRRALYMISKGKLNAGLEDVRPLLKDRDVFVRRGALRALAALKDSSGIPDIEKMLFDPENSVRCLAAVTLGDFNGPNTMDRLFEAVAKKGNFQFSMVAATEALVKIGPNNLEGLSARLSDPNLEVRRTAAHVIQKIKAVPSPIVKAALLKAVSDDSDAYVRQTAMDSLVKWGEGDQAVTQTAFAELKDKDEVVQMSAVGYLANVLGKSADTSNDRQAALAALNTFFRKFGDGCTRADADWGWRIVGNALLGFGPDGENILKGIMDQCEDKRLAIYAWQVLYIRQDAGKFCPVTEEEDAEAHAHYPSWIIQH